MLTSDGLQATQEIIRLARELNPNVRVLAAPATSANWTPFDRLAPTPSSLARERSP